MSLKKWLLAHSFAVSAVVASAVPLVLHFCSEVWPETFLPYFRAERALMDFVAKMSRPAEKHPDLVFLADDAASHDLDQLWPEDLEASPTLQLMAERVWTRKIWADVLDRLAGAGARVVAFDYMFKGKDDGDAALREAIERHSKLVVLGSHIDDRSLVNQQMPSINPPHRTILGEAADPRVGFINMFPDSDEVVRRMRFRVTREELSGVAAPEDAKVYYSMAARMMTQAGLDEKIPQGRGSHLIRYAYQGETLREATKPRSLFEIFVPAYWEANYQNGEFFRGKFVLVGPEGNYTKDVAMSPFGLVAGPELHLNAANALLTGEFLKATSFGADFCLIFIAGLLGWTICRFVRNAVVRLLLVPVLIPAAIYLGKLAFDGGLVVPVLSPLLAAGSTVILSTGWQILLERIEKARLRRTFERYVSRDVVKELLDNPQSYLNTVGGARKRISVLFSDVRGFTTITESGDAQALVAQLNEYFDHMVSIVFRYRGTLDKFIGDAVMAQWGGIRSDGEKADAVHAVRTAVEMRKSLAALNAQWIPAGKLELKFGIGINHGEAIVGNLGSREKSEISAIGDAVNTASRLEGMTKQFHVDLLIGEAVATFVREDFLLRTVALSQPKGKTRPLEIFTVIDEKAPGVEIPKWLDDYEEGIRLYRQREFSKAGDAFEKALAGCPGDWLCEHYLQLAKTLAANPPEPDWSPVDIMTSK
jgi:adenylate cyclase